MKHEPERLLASRRPSDRALLRDLGALKMALPRESSLQAGALRLVEDLANERELSDSGIREIPRALRQELAPLPSRARPRLRTRALLGVAALAAALALFATHHSTSPSAPPAPAPTVAAALPALPAAPTPANVAPGEASPRRVASAANHGTSPRARTRVRHPKPPTPPPVDTAVLNINSIPLSHVVLDGRPIGGTPRVQVEVTPGYHKVLFVHPEHGRKLFDVYVDAGQTVLAAVRFR